MYTLKYRTHFDGAHKLNNYHGKCSYLHGHRWDVEVEIQTNYLVNDMVIDFTILKQVVDELDHKYINDEVDVNPTAENLSKVIYDKINSKLIVPDTILKITIWESPNSSITYQQ